MEITIVNGKPHYKWQFSIATLNYQRVHTMRGKCCSRKISTEGYHKCFWSNQMKLDRGVPFCCWKMDAPRMKIEACHKCPWGTYQFGISGNKMKLEGCQTCLLGHRSFDKNAIKECHLCRLLGPPGIKVEWCHKCLWGTYHLATNHWLRFPTTLAVGDSCVYLLSAELPEMSKTVFTTGLDYPCGCSCLGKIRTPLWWSATGHSEIGRSLNNGSASILWVVNPWFSGPLHQSNDNQIHHPKASWTCNPLVSQFAGALRPPQVVAQSHHESVVIWRDHNHCIVFMPAGTLIYHSYVKWINGPFISQLCWITGKLRRDSGLCIFDPQPYPDWLGNRDLWQRRAPAVLTVPPAHPNKLALEEMMALSDLTTRVHNSLVQARGINGQQNTTWHSGQQRCLTWCNSVPAWSEPFFTFLGRPWWPKCLGALRLVSFIGIYGVSYHAARPKPFVSMTWMIWGNPLYNRRPSWQLMWPQGRAGSLANCSHPDSWLIMVLQKWPAIGDLNSKYIITINGLIVQPIYLSPITYNHLNW